MNVVLLTLIAGGAFANPKPETAKEEKRDARMVDSPYYVLNPEVPYPWRYHDIYARPFPFLPSFRSKLNAGVQYRKFDTSID